MFKRFAKDVLIYGISSSVTKFIGLLLVPVYTRVFSKEDYGTMDVIVAVVAICTIFGMMQLESAVSRYYYVEKNANARKTMISTGMWTLFTVSLILFLILVFFSSPLSQILFKSTLYSTIIIIGCLTIPLSNLTSFFTVIIQFKKKPLHYLLFQLLQATITITLTLYLIIFAKAGIIGIFWGQLIGFLFSALFMAVYLRKQLAFIWNYQDLKKMMRYSLPSVPAVAGSVANSYLNRFIMLGYLSIAEIGLYAVALKIASVFQLISSAFRMAWGPFFWATFENDANHREVFKKVQKEFSALVLMIVMMITLFSKEIILLLTTESYLPAAHLIGLISLALAISSIILPLTGIGPGIKKKMEYNTLIYFLGLSVNIGSLFLIVPTFGLIGVPISLLLGNIILLVVGWYNSEKLYPVGFKILPIFLYLLVTFFIILINIYFDLHLLVKASILVLILVYIGIKYYSKIVMLIKRETVLISK